MPMMRFVKNCLYSFFVSVIILSCGLINFCVITLLIDNIVQPTRNTAKNSQEFFGETDLSRYNGVTEPELYLSILGNVFDVSKNAKHYGPFATYHIFVGRDNSKAFITGNFDQESISDDILSLPADDVVGIDRWLKFYKKEYIKKGKLVGRYYDLFGNLTPYGKQVRKIIKSAEVTKANDNLVKYKYPPCNVEWDQEKGSRFWCTNQSGGIKRDWIGFPRQLFLPGNEPRCACIQKEELDKMDNIKQYDNCDQNEISCFFKPKDEEKLSKKEL